MKVGTLEKLDKKLAKISWIRMMIVVAWLIRMNKFLLTKTGKFKCC